MKRWGPWRPLCALVICVLVSCVLGTSVLTAPPVDAVSVTITPFSALVLLAPDANTPGVYSATTLWGFRASPSCKLWETDVSGGIPAQTIRTGSSSADNVLVTSILAPGASLTLTGQFLCRTGTEGDFNRSFPDVVVTAPAVPPDVPSIPTGSQKGALGGSGSAGLRFAARYAVASAALGLQSCPVCGTLASFGAALVPGLASSAAGRLAAAADPPDQGFASVVTPATLTEPVIAVGAGVSADLAAALNTVLANSADQASLSHALLVSLEREWGAVDAGASAAATKQAAAVSDYAGRYADALSRAGQLRAAVANLLDTTPGVPADLSPTVGAALDSVTASPLPSATLLTQNGATPADVATLRGQVAALASQEGNLSGSLSAILRQDDGESAAVSALKALAISAIPPPGPTTVAAPPAQKAGAGALKPIGCIGTGGVRACATTRALGGAAFTAISADGRSLYVAARDDDSIAVFRRNPATGALAQLSGAKGCVHDKQARAEAGCATGHGLLGVSQLVVTRDGKDVIASGRSSDAISVYKRAKDGSLAFLQCFAEVGVSGDPHCKQVVGLGDSQSVAVSGDGRSVYATGGSSTTLDVFRRTPKTGELSYSGCLTSESLADVASCASAPALRGVNRVLVAPNGRRVFVTAEDSAAVSAYNRDVKTGALRFLSCVSGDGTSTDPVCAAGKGVVDPQALALSPDGKQLYATVRNGIATILVNPVTGELSQSIGTAACLSWNEAHESGCGVAAAVNGSFGIAVSPDGHQVYAGSYASNSVTQYARNLVTGALTPISRCLSLDAAGCQHVAALEHAGWTTISPDGHFVYVNGPYSDAVVAFARRLPLALPKVVKAKVKASHGVIHVRLLCPKAAYGGCYGTLVARRGASSGRTVVYSLPGGRSAQVTVAVGSWRGATVLAVVGREPAGGRRSGRLRVTVL